MLKNRSAGEAIPRGEDRPRKKLSFRDPEVMAPVRPGPLSAPTTKSAASPVLSRPHSVTGVVGLGGFSALGGVPGMSSPTPPPPSPSSSTSFFKGVTSQPRIPSPSLPQKAIPPHLHNHSPTRVPSIKSESKPTSGQENGKMHSQSQRSPAPKKEDKSQGKEETPLSSPAVTRKSQPQSPSKPSSVRYAEGGSSSRGSQTKKNPPPAAQQAARQFTRKQQEDVPPSPTSATPDKDRRAQQQHQLAGSSLEDLELENQAMRVVRTVGQAFEVVHKMTQKDKSPSPEPPLEDDISREGSEDSSDKPKKDGLDSESGQEDLMTLTSDNYNEDPLDTLPSRPCKLEPLAPPVGSDITKKTVGETFSSPLSEPLPAGDLLPQAGTPLSVHHELQLLREQLEQQQQQTQAAVAQVHLLRDQLAAETAARLEAQARTHQLLVHNKDLLEHIQQLVIQVRDMEIKMQGGAGSGVGGGTSPTIIPMLPNLPDIKPELSAPSFSGGASDEAARPGLRAKRSSPLSPLSHTLPDTPPTPSPTRAAHTFFFPPSLQPPAACPSISPLIAPLPIHRQQDPPQLHPTLQQRPSTRPLPPQMHQLLTQEAGSSASLCSGDTDPKRDPGSAHSSGESVTAAIAQLYNMDLAGRLPQVPEDSVPLNPFATVPLGAHRMPLNGPITRAASERYSRQETLAQLQRMAWARHTTK